MHPSNFAHWSLSTARDLTLEAARDASNARKAPTRPLPSAQLKKLLDSRSERDVLEGLRRVVTVRAPHGRREDEAVACIS
jgi:AP-3 complex subunit beta